MERTVLLAVCLLAAPATAVAQLSTGWPQPSSAILGSDDAAFARELYLKGWTDLAEGVVEAFEKLDQQDQADPLDLLAVRAVGFDIKLELARREPDVAQRKQAIAAAIAGKEKLIEDHPRTAVGRDTRDNLPDAYRLLGEALTAALVLETDPENAAKLRDEGEAAYAKAESGFEARLKALVDIRLDDSVSDVQYMNALFNLGRTFYFHARFYPAEDTKRAELLDGAIRTLQDFGLEYGDRLLNFEAIYYLGLCHKAQSKHEDALVDWSDVVALREDFESDDQGLYEVSQDVADLISKSALQKVLLLTELGRLPEAIGAADDYWTTIRYPADAGSGLAVLGAKADAQLAADDTSAAGETARLLLDLDPEGPWGNKGREVLGKMMGGSGGSSIGPEEILRVAQNLFAQGRPEQALEAVQRLLASAKGVDKEHDFGSQALFLMGQVYFRKEWYHEASVAFDAASDLYPEGNVVPDAIAAAMKCYAALNREEKRPFYKARVEARGQTLASQFPLHPDAASVQLSGAREMFDDEKYREAAELFRRVPAGAAIYEEAQVQAGKSLFFHARVLLQESHPDQAQTVFAEAEATLAKALVAIASAKAKTLDSQVLLRLSGNEYTALATLCSLYLDDSIARPADVLTLLEGVDEHFANDPQSTEGVWTLRIRALEKLGRLDEAVTQFDALLVKQADRSGLSGAAGVLARSLDQRALDLSGDPANAKAADDGWRKSVGYYVLSVQAQLDNRSNARPAELEAVGKRLLEIGMHFNGVPEEANSFVDWHAEKPAETATWEKAAALYEATIALDTANYRARIGYGRTLGFLRRWKDSAATYASLFEQETLVKKDKTGFNPQTVQNKPELLDAYIEWGVSEAETGAAEKAADRQARASVIFDLLETNTTTGSGLWWNAKYRQVRTLFERGMYEPADVGLRNLERATAKDFADAPEGLEPLLLALRTEVSKKVKRKTP